MKKHWRHLKQGWVVAGALLVALVIVAGVTLVTAGGGAFPPSPKSKSAPEKTPKEAVVSNPLKDKTFYVDPSSNAAMQAARWRASRPADAKQMDKLAAMPSAKWLTNETDAGANLQRYLQGAKAKNSIAVTVLYNIPHRDCGMYSAGGADSEQQYRHFINTFATTVNDTPLVAILEPDALAQLQTGSCLSAAQKEARYNMLKYAVEKLKALPAVTLYIDGGNSAWIADPADIAGRLTKAGIAKADGFALNVSNFRATTETVSYGKKIAQKLGNKHFVIDTSRNGLGPYENKAEPEFNWCNPPGRALGHYPTTTTGESLVDAFLHIKNAGESDGTDADRQKCHGGPAAGKWWPEYALGLVQRWPKNLQPKN